MELKVLSPNRRAVAPQEVIMNAKLVVNKERLSNGNSVEHIKGHFKQMREFADFPVLVQTINRSIKDSEEVSPEAKKYVRRILRFLARNEITNDAHNKWLNHPERIRMFRAMTGRHPDDYGWRDLGPSI